MVDPLWVRRIPHPDGFLGVTAERPLTINMFPSFDGSHDWQVVVGYFHADRYQIDVGMLRQLRGIAKRQRHLVMPRRCICGILPGRGSANGHDNGTRASSISLAFVDPIGANSRVAEQ